MRGLLQRPSTWQMQLQKPHSHCHWFVAVLASDQEQSNVPPRNHSFVLLLLDLRLSHDRGYQKGLHIQVHIQLS